MEMFWLGGEGPKDIPSPVYLYLMTTLKVPSETMVKLRSVLKPGFYNGKPVTFFRIYDPNNEQLLQVKNFIYLDEHPELIIYEGYWENNSDHVYMEHQAGKKTDLNNKSPLSRE